LKLIVTATTRKESLTLQIAKIVQDIYKHLQEDVDILDLKEVPFSKVIESPYQTESISDMKQYLDRVAKAEALILICPEYNGGLPGLIKHFIDHWHYPESFVFKPVCLIGLGGKFGALRPVEQLQNILLYRHSFIFPVRVFIQNVQSLFKNGELQDDFIQKLLRQQAYNFKEFVRVIPSAKFK